MDKTFAATINYTDKNGDDKSIDCQLKFLSPALRAEIIKFDMLTQLEFKKHQKELSSDQQTIDNRAKLDKYIEELLANDPEISEDELAAKRNIFLTEIVSNLSEDDMKSNMETLIDTYKQNDEYTIKFFQLIVKKAGLSDNDKALICSDHTSDFWQNVDIKGVQIYNQSFRLAYPI